MPKWHTAFGWLVQPISEAISEASSGRVSIRSGVELCPSRAQMHGVSRGTPGAASKESWEPSIWGSSPSNKARDGSLLGKYAMNPIVFINMYIYIYTSISQRYMMGYNWYNVDSTHIITLYYIPIYDYYMTRMIFWVCIPTSEPLMFIPPWYSQYVSTISPFYPHHHGAVPWGTSALLLRGGGATAGIAWHPSRGHGRSGSWSWSWLWLWYNWY